ncbi:MAG: hypothetical protein R3D01_05400 [Hyphomicrobiales bacterium]
MPSVLLELGLSNEDDEKQLTREWRSRMADSVIAAIDGYFTKRTPGCHFNGAFRTAR